MHRHRPKNVQDGPARPARPATATATLPYHQNHHRDGVCRCLILLCAYLSSSLYAALVTTYSTPPFPLVAYSETMMTNGIMYPDSDEMVYCVGFRRTSCEDGYRMPWWDLTCDELIPRTASGHCEYHFANGTLLTLFHKKTCRGGAPKLAKSATCRMAVDFDNYRRQAQDFRPDPPMPLPLHNNKKGNNQQNHESGRGIVMAVYPDVLLSVYAILYLLRDKHGCTLPIELWSIPGELDMDTSLLPLFRGILQLPKVTHRTIPDDAPEVAGFMIKPYSIFYSNFTQVLWVDSDNVPLRDPSYLFASQQYSTTGTLFFKDYWQPAQSIFFLNQDSLVWELLLGMENHPFQQPQNSNTITSLDSNIKTHFEMESGQLLIDKRRTNTQQALSIVLYLASTFHTRWLGPLALLWGDKDLFRMGFYMTQLKNSHNSSSSTPLFSYVEKPPSPMGYTIHPENANTYAKLTTKSGGSTTCGVTMVQYDPQGKPIFLHRNSFKLNQHTLQQPIWERIYEFTGNDPSTEYRIGSTKDKARGLTCYHPEAAMGDHFQERGVSNVYPEIVTAEKHWLEYVNQGRALLTTIGNDEPRGHQ